MDFVTCLARRWVRTLTNPFPAGDINIGGYTSMPTELTLPIYINVGTKLTPREHPILSTVIGVGATLATLVLGAKGLKKLAPMAKKLVKPEFAEKISKAANNFITKLNDKVTGSKVIDKLTKGISAMPSALKKVLKGAAEWGPLALVFASIAHTSRFANAKRAQTEKNYQELKIAQAEARELLKMPELPEVDI